MSTFRLQVFWREDYFKCWNFIIFLSLRSLNHLFLDLNQPVSLLASSSLEDFSLISENKEPQMTAGAQVGSTGAAFIVNFASRLRHVKLLLPCTCSGNISITASTCSSFTNWGRFPCSFSVPWRLWELLFFCLTLFWSGEVSSRKEAECSDSAMPLYPFYQENLIQTFIHKNVTCCQ